MTNELEKQFFDTFGINCIKVNDIRNLTYRYIFIDKITDICTNLDETYINLVNDDIVVTDENVLDILEKISKHQVRTLFEEEK